MPCKKAFSKTSKCCSLFLGGGVEGDVQFCCVTNAVLFCSFIFLAKLFLSQCSIVYYSHERNAVYSGRDSDALQRDALQLVKIPAHSSRITE